MKQDIKKHVIIEGNRIILNCNNCQFNGFTESRNGWWCFCKHNGESLDMIRLSPNLCRWVQEMRGEIGDFDLNDPLGEKEGDK